ncbi:MAG: extracellular solute-binding protein [Bacilli bacterium]|nr:extracellular solute-binding protein [Bacilli bacterium]
MKKLKLLTATMFSVLALTAIQGCTPPEGEKIVLKIGFWPETSEKKDVAMYQEWEKQFEAAYPQYDIVGDHYTYDTTTIATKHLTDSLPTVFQTWFTEPLKLVDKGYIRSIDEQLKAADWLDDMDPDMKAALTFDNKVYGIPRDGYGLGLLINIKTLGECGLLPENEDGTYSIYNEDGSPAYPTTFEEIMEFSLTISESTDTKGILICSANKNGGWQFSNMAWNYGATLQSVDNNGKVTSHLNCEEAVKALTWIQDMKLNDTLLNSISIVYDDWYNAINERVAMAIVGSDVLHVAQTNGGVDMDNLAFVPMPTGDGIHRYSLYGGTPYVFAKSATDEQVEGVLKFFEYVGRTPKVSDISKAAMVQGFTVAQNKNQPVLPTIKPWINEEYVTYAESLEDAYVDVKMENYQEFFDNINQNKHSEVQYGAQEMYEYLDAAIQSVLSNPETANPKSLLTTANAQMQQYLDKNVNK